MRARAADPARIRTRFFGHVELAGPVLVPGLGPCHIWTGSRNRINGYGRFQLQGKVELAHRVRWLLEYGRWPDECALHSCDGGHIACVRIDHLFEGTQTENVRDALQKGRLQFGDRQGCASITNATACDIAQLLKCGGLTYKQIAERVGTKEELVGRIARGDAWSKVVRG